MQSRSSIRFQPESGVTPLISMELLQIYTGFMETDPGPLIPPLPVTCICYAEFPCTRGML